MMAVMHTALMRIGPVHEPWHGASPLTMWALRVTGCSVLKTVLLVASQIIRAFLAARYKYH